MQDCLLRKEVFATAPVALSLGGDRDRADNLPATGRDLLRRAIRESGVPFIEEPDLVRNVQYKMNLFEEAAQGSEIKAFINIGGSISNIGTDAEVLNLKPGLVNVTRFPPPERRGLLFAMAAREIPVAHLLFIRGLVQEYGLPYDPVPLPAPGEGAIYQNLKQHSLGFMWLALVYLLLYMGILAGAYLAKLRRRVYNQRV
jgi:poly-gamma-glutamate system protein